MIIPSGERVLVTGASGWLGRELLTRVTREIDYEHLLLVGSKDHLANFNGQPFRIHEWTEEIAANWAPTSIVHLAFGTREKLIDQGYSRFTQSNAEISRKARSLMSLSSVENFFWVSSGAALTEPDGPYGSQKRIDEVRFQELATKRGVNLFTARAWSLTGANCTKPKQFLFYDLIRQSMSGSGIIELGASSLTFRRYVDAGQFLALGLSAMYRSAFSKMDSGGVLIEAAELAERISVELSGMKSRVMRPNFQTDAAPDLYYSNSRAMNEIADELRIRLASLPEQIKVSSVALGFDK